MTTAEAVDLDAFAGPGGWEVGGDLIGVQPIGIEFDDAACATRRAAGLATLQADVAALDPADFAPVRLFIASPPCPTFSGAGQGRGRQLTHVIEAAMEDLAAGKDTRAERREDAREVLYAAELDKIEGAFAGKPARPREVLRFIDSLPERLERANDIATRDAATSMLVVEPLRWALELRPQFIALEQVPPVLALWKTLAGHLEAIGYGTWTGILEAERYGVPQTRERAILMAELDGHPQPPRPTHQRYVPGEPACEDLTLEGPILPWVSMAEALGWGMTARPYPVIASGRETGGPDKEKVGGSAARAQIYAEQDAGRWTPPVLRANNQPNAAERAADEPAPTIAAGHSTDSRVWLDRRSKGGSGEPVPPRFEDEPAPTITSSGPGQQRDVWRGRGVQKSFGEGYDSQPRPADEPAPTVDGKARSWKVVDTGNTRGGTRTEGRTRPADAPAPVVTSRADQLERREDWTEERPAPTLVTGRRSDRGMLVGRQLAPGDGRNVGGADWVDGRPATTVAGDNRVHPPGHKENSADPPGKYEQRRGANAVRVSIEEAAVLQSFPVDYPWQGTKTKRFQQIGNAVPPLLARAILAALLRTWSGKPLTNVVWCRHHPNPYAYGGLT